MHGMKQHAHAATVLNSKLHIVGDMREKAACTCSKVLNNKLHIVGDMREKAACTCSNSVQ
jgi:hypothetical protein